MTEELELPFKVEYAKSGRASCKGCKNNISKDELRLAVMVQSPMFDGKIPNWYHFSCFFTKQKVKTTGDISGFNALRWEDQKKIKDKIGGAGGGGNGAGASGSSTSQATDFSDFTTEYAKSNKSTCRGCDEKIGKGEVRIAKKDYESMRSKMYGPQNMWYHVDCFIKKREELEFFGGAEDIPGFMTLGAEEQKDLKTKLKRLKNKRKAPAASGDPPTKKSLKSNSEEEKKLKEQSDIIFSYMDSLKALSKRELQDLLEYNDQEVPSGESRILQRLADCMTFGALKKCSECGGQLAFKDDAYRCTGDISAWAKCQYSSQNPERVPFKVPDELKEAYPFFKKYKFKKRERVYPANPDGPSRTIHANGPLANLKVVVIGKLGTPKEDIGKLIETYKGTLTSKVEDKVVCVISTEDEVKSMSKKMVQVKNAKIPVVSEKFLEELPKMKSPNDVAAKITELKICEWGDDPMEKIQKILDKEETKKSIAWSHFIKDVPEKMKMTVKGGAAVDPESGLENTHQVYAEKGCIYNAILGSVDIAKGRNSFYKLQLLKSDKSDRFAIFRSWGRVGTTIGGTKVDHYDSRLDAILEFKKIYEEKTGNRWEDRDNFVKHPGKFYPIDVDYGDECSELKKLQPGKNSKLPVPVQELISLIFDIESMKKAMLEFEIDLKKMPLGKLSKKQLEKAYSVLSEAQELIKSGATAAKMLDISNQFYTLIPHDFGMKKPPLLDNEDLIKSKREMLDSLLEIEVAYNLLRATDSDKDVDPIDQHYEQLKAAIDVLPRDHEEFKTIEKYVKNTHGETHNQYTLNIDQIFKVSRHEESKRFKPFKKLHNRKLLWHGSRLTNYAGILSHGLKIAPPEAPVTGYMFGKGIYFADMVSKSANYCQTNKSNPTGLLLLCEVALGNMYERTQAEFVTKLPPDYHSTKGIGKSTPDPSQSIKTPDGVEIPLGNPIKEEKKTALLYNEYIVYDIAQVSIKYLVKVDFKWKY